MKNKRKTYETILNFIELLPRKYISKHENSNFVNTFQPSPYYLVGHFLTYILTYIKFNAKILDAGCGISPIILFLKLKGYHNLTGIDLNFIYLDKLDALFSCIDTDEYYAYPGKYQDIVTFDYSNFDVIYSFNPLWGHSFEKKKEYYLKIFNTMKVGAIFFESFPIIALKTWVDYEKFEVIPLNHNKEFIYKKIK
jgi:2-polyprenyl-3-methyl-5-hydroxy-6-metoxy-1,4-benzoquinol methylase